MDASVFGSVFDQEFAADSTAFFDQAGQNRFVILTSVLVAEEIAQAPTHVREFFDRVLELRSELR